MSPGEPPSTPEAVQVLVYLARLEGKLDTALAHHGTRLEEQSRAIGDHESRLRILEALDTVSPRQLWAVTVTGISAIAVASPFLARLFSASH